MDAALVALLRIAAESLDAAWAEAGHNGRHPVADEIRARLDALAAAEIEPELETF